MTKTQEISRRIAELVKSGLSVKEAFDAVLGCGSYDRIASDVYDALRSK